MFDLAAVQAASEQQARRLAALRLPRPQRAGPPRARLRRRRHPVAALVLLRPRAGRAAQARPPHRAARPRRLPGPASRSTCAGRNWKPASAELVAGRASASRWSTCRATPTPTSRASMPAPSSWCARSASRSCPSGDLVQLFEACWDDEQWAHAPGSGQAHALGLRRRLRFIADRVRRPAAVRETEVQQVILDHFAEARPGHAIIRRSSPSARTAAIRTTRPAPASDARDPRGRLRAHRPVGQARPAARRLQRPDAGPASSARRCRRSTRRSSRSSPRPATPPSTSVQRRLRRRASRCRAGRSTRRPATSSSRPATASTSATAPATPSARRRTATAPTWTTWRRTRSAASCRGPASRSSRASTCRSSASAAR